MATVLTGRKAESLEYFLGRLHCVDGGEGEISPGKRRAHRFAMIGPAWVRECPITRQTPARPFSLRDISELGIGLTSKSKIEPGQGFVVEVALNGIVWRDYMTVIHATEVIGTYEVGLELGEPPPPKSPGGQDENHLLQLRQLMWQE